MDDLRQENNRLTQQLETALADARRQSDLQKEKALSKVSLALEHSFRRQLILVITVVTRILKKVLSMPEFLSVCLNTLFMVY